MYRYPDAPLFTRLALDFWAFCVAVGVAGALFVASVR